MKGSGRGLVLLLVVLSLAACGGSGKVPVGGTGAGGSDWQVGIGPGGVSASVPSDWKVEREAGALRLSAPGGCAMLLWLEPGAPVEGLSQAQRLEYMVTRAGEEHKGQVFEVVGKRVWLGENYIWHEVHYVGDGQGGTSYTIDLLAKLDAGPNVIAGRYRCPGEEPPSEDATKLLEQVMETIQAPAGQD